MVVELLLAAVVLVVLAVVLWLLTTTRRELGELRQATAPADAVTELLRRQIETVRAEGREGQDNVRREVGDLALRMRGDIGDLQQTVATELKGVSSEVTHQLHEGMKLFQTAQTTMGERLDRAARVVSEVQGSLGKLGEATQRVVEVGKDIQGLEQILKSPKVRGGLGETLLAELLSQMLPQEHYTLQHPFKSGERVDAALRIGDRLVAVDAKFPLENFRRMLDETEEDKRRPVRRQFARDVRTRIDEIAKKYILPDEGTFDFALMYVPAENVYYEIIIKDETDLADDPIATYALSKRVVPVSPNSLYAYLQVIILGLRGLRIEANAQIILNDLARLAGDLDKVREPLRTPGRRPRALPEGLSDPLRRGDRAGRWIRRGRQRVPGNAGSEGGGGLRGVGRRGRGPLFLHRGRGVSRHQARRSHPVLSARVALRGPRGRHGCQSGAGLPRRSRADRPHSSAYPDIQRRPAGRRRRHRGRGRPPRGSVAHQAGVRPRGPGGGTRTAERRRLARREGRRQEPAPRGPHGRGDRGQSRRVDASALRRRSRRRPDLRPRRRRHEGRAGRRDGRRDRHQAKRCRLERAAGRRRAGRRRRRHDRRQASLLDRDRPRARRGDHLRARAERALSRAARRGLGAGRDPRPHGPRRDARSRCQSDHGARRAAPGGAGARAPAAPPLPPEPSPASADGHAHDRALAGAGRRATERDPLERAGAPRR